MRLSRNFAFLLAIPVALGLVWYITSASPLVPSATSRSAPGGDPAPAATAQPAASTAETGSCQVSDSESAESQQGNEQAIKVDQVGYLPGARKLALVVAPKATTYKLVDIQTNRAVCSGQLSEPFTDEDTGDTVRTADFSNWTRPGTYVIVVPGVGRSYSFRIADDAYDTLFKDAISSYDLLARLAPPLWKAATARSVLYTDHSKTVDVSGGWPDAGDYGKYMPTAAATVGQLLAAWELFQDRLAAVHLDVERPGPEPDYLRVVREELDWMMKMQRADGAVHHKVTPENFGPFSKGDDAIGGTQYLYDISTPDTALFAAAMAKASIAYRPYDPDYAGTMLAAAERAWAFLEKNPSPILPSIKGGTGAYNYPGDDAQRFWAAAELFRATGKKTYDDYIHAYFKDSLSPKTLGPISWLQPQGLGMFAYYWAEGGDADLKAQVRRRTIGWADEMVSWVYSPVNPYRVSLSTYAWASNKAALDNAMTLVMADAMAQNPAYRQAALEQLHYVLGRNTLSKSFVTGHGANPVRNPHNRTMFMLGRVVPGVLVGGPNSAAQDGLVKAGDGPRSYLDDWQAYSVNENSIEYNAPLVFLLAAFYKGS